MTESEWLTSNDPLAMMRWIEDGRRYHEGRGAVHEYYVSDRKLLLFACACVAASGDPVEESWEEKEPEGSPYQTTGWHDAALSWAEHWAIGLGGAAPMALRAELLREIIGNPWRPIRCRVTGHMLGTDTCGPNGGCDCRWLYHNEFVVQKIAQAIYDDRRFDDMPILADALEDAGCSNEEMLRHCRGEILIVCGHCDGDGKAHGSDRPFEWSANLDDYLCPTCRGSGRLWRTRPFGEPHVRGCAILDILIGKE